ncbi:MAG: hypothetical protein QM731_17520 [Chitinophagaceae bacterium]
MFEYLFGGFALLILTAILLIPFSFSVFYVVLGWREHSIGMKEHNELKRRSGLKTIFIASLAGVLIFLIWIVVLIYFG